MGGERPGNLAAFDRARTFVTLLVVIYHAASNYTYFGQGDHQRWIGFDIVVLFADSFFMPLMYFISGLFVWHSLDQKGAWAFLRDRFWRLGVPFLASIFILIPLAYYPSFLRYHLPGTTDFSLLFFLKRTFTVGPWPSGPVWFLWVLLAFNILVTVIWKLAPQSAVVLRQHIEKFLSRPLLIFVGVIVLTLIAYVPARLYVGPEEWLADGPVSVQASRILLYTTYFLAGVVVGSGSLRQGLFTNNGAFATRWQAWAAVASMSFIAVVALAYRDELSPDTRLRNVGEAIAFSFFCAAMGCSVLAVAVRFARSDNIAWRFLDAMSPVAYGIFLTHFIFVMWLQYAVFPMQIPAMVKFAFVLAGALSGSWIVTRAARSLPVIARMI